MVLFINFPLINFPLIYFLIIDLKVNEMKTKLPSYAQPLFIRFVSSIDATGTFKFKKNALKEDG